MSRAVILPTIGDPFLLNGWLKSYLTIWHKEVDQVYIRITSALDPKILCFLKKWLESYNIKVWILNHVEQHGDNINFLLKQCKEDYIVLLEDDVFILQPGNIDNCFKHIEQGLADCVGSTRGCCSAEMCQAIDKKFHLKGKISPEHGIHDCPNLWPSLFFCKTSLLKETDQNFNAVEWPPNTYIKELDWVTQKTENGDTFVWTSIQLRTLNKRISYIHQRHAGPIDIQERKTMKGLFVNEYIPWVHFGSLSSGITGLIQNEQNIPLGCIQNSTKSEYAVVHPTLYQEMSRRLALFKIIAKFHGIQHDVMHSFNNEYKKGVNKAITALKLSQDMIFQFEKTYALLLYNYL